MGSDPISFCDAQGTRHAPAGPDARIACLVPSITELVCELGLTDRLVARTGFCVHPREVVASIPKVGGTKDLDIARLKALAPTHAIVNIDENRRPEALQIAEFVPHVVVTHPLGPDDNLPLYRLIGGIFGADKQAALLSDAFEQARAQARRECAALPRETVLYLIWKDPWMTVARDTYISRTLAEVGWDTLPVDAGARYPEIELAAAAAGAGRILLSSEPYRFTTVHVDAMRRDLPGQSVMLIDGEMTSWYGPRAITGMHYLARLRKDLSARDASPL
ncbi:MAG: helical backbone metal receptor [Burkholderiales bacterium]